jgi:hypothetical protein
VNDENGLPPEGTAEEAPEAPEISPEPAPVVPEAAEPPAEAITAGVSAASEAGSEAELDDADDSLSAAEATTGTLSESPRPAPRGRPDLADRREPLYRECRGYRLRLDPPDLARLRELPGSRGRSDTEIGEAFFDGQADRLAASIVDDVPSPNEIRVVVDPYSRQAFLALENRIRGILSF